MSARWGGSESRRLKALVQQEKGFICHLCWKPITGGDSDYHPDHLIPRSKGGDNSLDNLFPSHAKCNMERGDKPIELYRAAHTNQLRWFAELEP